jgi:hypothetical protein
MANPVNPPPFLRVPRAFLKDKEVREFVEQQNTVLFQLYQKLGGSTDPIADLENSNSNGFSSQVQWMQQQINGLPAFTMETEGFTMDADEWTMDKVTA